MSAVAPARLEPFTLGHFLAYAERIILDNGENWHVEDYQIEVLEPILAGVREVWGVIPEGNAKTTIMAGYALYHADYTPSPWVPIAASSRDQAEIMARQAYQMIRSSPGMLSRFKIYEGYREIRSLRNGGRGIKVYAADATTGDGVIPTLCLCDEGHRWPNLDLYRLWKGKLDKRNGQIVMISTAGEPGGEFEETRDQIRSSAPDRASYGAHIRSVGPDIVMNEWRVEKEEWITDMERVKAANPFSGITVDSLTRHFNSPTTDLGDFKRLKCNIPARTVHAAITDTEWAAADARVVREPPARTRPKDVPPDIPEDEQTFEVSESYATFREIPAGERIDVGIDVAWKHDTFAISPLYQAADFHLLGPAIVLEPPRDGSSMHPDVVKMAFETLYERTPVDAAVMDMERAEDIAAWLEDEMGVTIIDRPQGNANACEDYDVFMKCLRNGKLKHCGDEALTRHVMNAIARQLPGDKKRFDRPSQSRARRKQTVRVIDALTAAAMVVQYVGEPDDNGELMVAWR